MTPTVCFVIRLWAPPAADADADKPHFVQQLEPADGQAQWTMTRVFDEAHLFKHERVAMRVVRKVRRVRQRIDHGWLYEVLKLTEEIVDTNVVAKKKETA